MEAVLPQVMCMTHWVSVAEYARASGIQVRSAYLRVKRGVVSHIKVQDVDLIDMAASPPARRMRHDAPQAPPFVWHAELPPREDLILASTYCERNTTRGHTFYRAMLQGKVRGWIMGDQLFVEKTLDPEPFKRKAAPAVPRVNRGRRWY